MRTHSELARDLFASGCNCAQAVAGAFADVTGLPRETMLRLASPFGGGMGRMRETCGAVTGAFIVMGLCRGVDDASPHEAKAALYADVQQFAADFKAVHGTIVCRDLLAGLSAAKTTAPQPEDRTPEYYRVRPCVRFVETAAELLDRYLGLSQDHRHSRWLAQAL